MRHDRDSATRVLVVDDNALNVTMLVRLLARAGITEVLGVTRSHEVMECIRNFDPDVILLDLHMPHPDGFELLEAIGHLSEDDFLPVVVLTADIDDTARQRALQGGAADFLTKPFPAAETLLRVRNLARTRRMHRELQRYASAMESQLDEYAGLERAATSRAARVNAVVHNTDTLLRMLYQPIVSLDTGVVVGAEALARFSATPIRPPNEWFADAAEAKVGTQLEIAAIRAALDNSNLLPANAFLSINTSPATLTSGDLVHVLRLNTQRPIVVELTEHEAVTDYAPINAAMSVLRTSGTRLAVDDAGGGFASLHHILHLKPDFIKLDRPLITHIDTDPARRSLTGALITFARETGAELIAEGIETTGELHALRDLGVPYGQGYVLARPGALPLNLASIAKITRI